MARPRRRATDLLLVGIWVVALVLVGIIVADAWGGGPGPTTTLVAGAAAEQSATAVMPTPPSTTTQAVGTTETTTSTTLPPLTVTAAGDVIGDRQVGTYIDAHGGEAALQNVAPFLVDAQLTFVNLESPLSDQGSRNTAKDVTFRGRPALVDGLASAGVDVVSLANNHALDWGGGALLDTIARLDAAGIAHAGAGADLASAREPALLDTAAGAVAILAFTDIIPEGFPAGTDRPGVNPVRPDRDRLLADVREAASAADWVIVSLHWGIEYEGYAGGAQRELAHDVVDAGADLVLGHHPHVLQGFELYKDRLIAYSLGDFVFDHYSRATGETVILQAELTHEGPPTFSLVPVYLKDPHGIPAPVSGTEADAILDRVAGFSERLGLTLIRDGDRARYAPD